MSVSASGYSDEPLAAATGDSACAGSGSAMLVVEGVDASYGRSQVLFDASVCVGRGERVALLGTNGAGKSTLLKVAAGLLRPDRGAVHLAGRDVTRMPAEERVRRSLALVLGGDATFPSLSVEENLVMGIFPLLHQRTVVRERLDEALSLLPQLAPKLQQRGGTLSGGEQQLLALGRALIARPELLMIDELSLGLAPVVVQEAMRITEELAARGVSILLVEQSLNVAVALTSRAYFMEKGEIRFSGQTAELLKRGDLVRSVFFGERAG